MVDLEGTVAIWERRRARARCWRRLTRPAKVLLSVFTARPRGNATDGSLGSERCLERQPSRRQEQDSDEAQSDNDTCMSLA